MKQLLITGLHCKPLRKLVPSAQYATCACRRSRGDYQGEWASLMLPLDLLSLFRFFRNTKEMKNPALAET